MWYLDLWQNHSKLDRPQEDYILRACLSQDFGGFTLSPLTYTFSDRCTEHFESIGNGQWQWLIIVVVITFIPSVVFVLIELFRETKAHGSTAPKSSTEVFLEGVCFLTLISAWTPTVMIATTPRGAASLIGNSYFTTWLMSIFVCEGLIWFIHDKRNETYYALKVKEEEYRRRQRRVLEQARAIQQRHEEGDLPPVQEPEGRSRSGRTHTESFDANDGYRL
jgi:hypothetical protein